LQIRTTWIAIRKRFECFQEISKFVVFHVEKRLMKKWLFYILYPIVHTFLWSLDIFFQLTRKKITPRFPYDKKTKTITLPADVDREIYQLAVKEGKPQAVKKVTELTGAGLRISKNYVDELLVDIEGEDHDT